MKWAKRAQASVSLPFGFGIIDRGEGIAIGLLLAEVRAHCFGITVLGERPVGARGVCQAIYPVPTVALFEQPLPECRLRLVVGM